MKILHVVDTLDPADGGPAVSVPSLAAAQASGGHDVGILFRESGFGTAGLSGVGHIPGISRVRLLPLRMSNARLAAATVFQRARLDETLRGNEVLHLQGIWRPLLYLSGFAALRLGIPYTVAPRGMLGTWSLGQKSLKKSIALRLGWRTLLNRAGFLQALNAAERDQINPLGLQCPIEIIPNGTFAIPGNRLPSSSAFRAAFPALENRPYILFLSRLHYMKGLDYLVQAFAALCQRDSDIQLVVAGPDAGQRTPMEELARARAVSHRVHFVGPIYGDLKHAAMAGAACFCQPSRQEGFSMAILEAMSCGLPAVISHAAHFPEVEECGAGRVVDPDSSELAEALQHYISDPRARTAAGAAAIELVATQFAWPEIARQSVIAYERLVSRRRVPAGS